MKFIFSVVILFLAIYAIGCGLLFFFQEAIIFHPEKLNKDLNFQFDQPFEEVKITTKDNKNLHGLFFKANQSKGLIFYLHGNAGSVKGWGDVAKTYTDLHYDVFIIDYRGYGKSEGDIRSEQQFYNDIQMAYNLFKENYEEKNIVVLGYSIGTGAAAKVASENNPKLLILQAPYYNLKDIMKQSFPFVPTFLLKYKFETNKFIQNCKMPVVIFHGDKDEVIYYGSSLKLQKLFKENDKLFTLRGMGHNGITYNPEYNIRLREIL